MVTQMCRRCLRRACTYDGGAVRGPATIQLSLGGVSVLSTPPRWFAGLTSEWVFWEVLVSLLLYTRQTLRRTVWDGGRYLLKQGERSEEGASTINLAPFVSFFSFRFPLAFPQGIEVFVGLPAYLFNFCSTDTLLFVFCLFFSSTFVERGGRH